ncbi:glycosyltransferase family A protein [Pseudomonas sp. FP198]|uniref:glycosyltransferase family 2 protein n=1 Tax=Pseudomonas sp. FP198 TaxID=2954084 RepID=UPI0027324EB2|nr:glycosyltransferase family A protein [Pseudomonas sp. FP198]WLG95377.1 glycosyltransferase family A protein [Pseudomonas sp. FP198]
MTEVLISVVIPAYNYAETLPRAVNSVIAQLGEAQAELLVIDDGSTDATPQVLEQLQAEHAGLFRALRKPNGGLSSVRNRGIEEARGQYLIFLDADDEMAPGALAAVTRHVASHPETRLVIGGHWSVFPDGRRVQHAVKPLPATPRERVRGYLLDKTVTLSNGACAMHREVFGPGNYPEHLRNVEDIPVFAQVLARFPCTVLDQPLALIYKHGDSMRHDLRQSLAAGVGMVDEVFSPARMPQSLQDLRKAFMAQRCLSLFRDCYSAGDYANAKAFYAQAVRTDVRSITRWSYTRKAIRLLFK